MIRHLDRKPAGNGVGRYRPMRACRDDLRPAGIAPRCGLPGDFQLTDALQKRHAD